MLISMQWRHVRSFSAASRVTPLKQAEVQKGTIHLCMTRFLVNSQVKNNLDCWLWATGSVIRQVVEGVDCWGMTGMVGRKDGWMEAYHPPAFKPTCCLCNALIGFRCEWTWHCDINEFHSLQVSSSPYCINMPLMFHSDTGLFSCTSPITNGSDKYSDNDMTVNGIPFSFWLISHGCEENAKSQSKLYPHLHLLPIEKLVYTVCQVLFDFSAITLTKEIRDKPLHGHHITSSDHPWPLSGLWIFMLYCSQLSAFLTTNKNKMTLVKK